MANVSETTVPPTPQEVGDGQAIAGGGGSPAATADALRQLLQYPLIDALTYRRSRRFSLGASIPGGGLAYGSAHQALPLTKLEEALLAFAAVGVTGLCLGDVPYASGQQFEAGGGNVMAALTGRTGASADAVHGAALFVINDEGTYLLRRPQDFPLSEINELAELARHQQFEAVYDRMRLKVREGRAGVRREVPSSSRSTSGLPIFPARRTSSLSQTCRACTST